MHILIDGLMMVITGAEGNTSKNRNTAAAADTNNDDLLVKNKQAFN